MSSATVTTNQSGTTKPSGFGIDWKPWDLWVLVLPLVAMSPLLLVQFQKLMNRPERQFFPLLILIAFYFPIRHLIDHRDESHKPVPLTRLWVAIGTLILAVLLFVFSASAFSPWGAHMAALMVFFAWALGRCSQASWTSVAAWTGVLLVTVPLPLEMDSQFIAWLQTASSAACGYALDALGVPHVRLANVIEIKGHQLFVEEACSGIGSLYALLAAAALLVVVNGRSLLVSIVVVASVPMWALLGNFLRLLAIALAQQWYDRDLSHGLDHDLLGLLTFSLAALGLWMTEWLATGFLQPLPPSSPELSFIFQTVNAAVCWPNADPLASIVDVEDETPQERSARELRAKARAEAHEAAIVRVEPWSIKSVRLVTRVVAISAILVGILPAIIVSRNASADMLSFGIAEFSEERLAKLPGEESLPKAIGEWLRSGYFRETRSTASAVGTHSLIWEYRKAGQRYVLSVDFPFRGIHFLELCYKGAGWTIGDVRAVKDTGKDSWDWREIVMSNELSSHGFVCYALCDEDGSPFANIPETIISGSLTERLKTTFAGKSLDNVFQPLVYQIQLICEKGRNMNEEEMQELREQFTQARHILRAELVKSLQ